MRYEFWDSSALEASHHVCFGSVPEESASHILSALAKHYGTSESSQGWQAATMPYRAYLTDYFRTLQSTAPEWLRIEGASLTLGECIPPVNQQNRQGFRAFLSQTTRLKTLVESATAQFASGTGELERRRLELHHQSRDRIARCFQDTGRQLLSGESETLLAEPDSLREQEGLGLAARGR